MAKLDERSPERVEEVLDAMKNVKLDNNKVFIMYGTLLGAVREKGFIGHDDDIDFAYLSNYHTVEEVRNEMYDIYKELSDKGQLHKYFTSGQEQYKLQSRDNFNGRGQAHIRVDKGFFDLWTAWVDEAGVFHCHPAMQLGSEAEFISFKEYEINGYKFKSLNNAELFLERFYGLDWRTPKAEKPKYKYYNYTKLVK